MDTHSAEAPLRVPESIGVALSGGGHRATAFGLGVLLYLVDSGLNRRVRSIASVSGGSILNAFVALIRSEDGTEQAFNSFQPGEFDRYATQLSRLLIGSRRTFRTAAALAVTLCSVAVAAAASGVVAATPTLIGLATGMLLVSTLLGPHSGGTLWGWWGTWAYCSSLALLLVAVVIGMLDGWSPVFLLLLTLLIGWLMLHRPLVAEKAFARTVCRRRDRQARRGSAQLQDMNTSVRHVFCATEMHSGQHSFLSHDFVYARGFGLGTPGGLSVAAAVQVSANFPGGFPIRMLRAGRFRFWVTDRFEDVVEHGFGMGRDILMPDEDHVRAARESRFLPIRPAPSWLMLTDGGVFDNLATDWYLESAARLARFRLGLNWGYDIASANWDRASGVSRDPLMLTPLSDSAQGLFVVNAGVTTPWRARSSVLATLPLIGEILGLSHISGTMYNNHTNERLRILRNQGMAVVDMSAGERLVATTLLPLGNEITRRLVSAGYNYAMTEAHERFGVPYFTYDGDAITAVVDGRPEGPRNLVPLQVTVPA